jgi:hypothetical protein
MDQIEVNIKLQENNQIYTLPIGKSDTVLKLKEYCKIISNIPQDQQNLLYKGKILLDEKLINDYNIENNNDIILAKKEASKSDHIPINLNSINLNEIFINNNDMNFSNNKEINPNDICNALNKVPDVASFFNNLDLNLIDNLFQSLGLGKYTDILGPECQQMKEMLKDPSKRDMVNNMLKDPSMIEILLNNPSVRPKIQNNPLAKNAFQNSQSIINPQIVQMSENMLKESERNSIENSGIGISVPPDPFGNLNNNQINQNSSGQKQKINTFNNNNIEKKENFRKRGNYIDYKEKYKEQLSQLKSMGFTNEEINIQALKQCNGNIENAFDKILEMNN